MTAMGSGWPSQCTRGQTLTPPGRDWRCGKKQDDSVIILILIFGSCDQQLPYCETTCCLKMCFMPQVALGDWKEKPENYRFCLIMLHWFYIKFKNCFLSVHWMTRHVWCLQTPPQVKQQRGFLYYALGQLWHSVMLRASELWRIHPSKSSFMDPTYQFNIKLLSDTSQTNSARNWSGSAAEHSIVHFHASKLKWSWMHIKSISSWATASVGCLYTQPHSCAPSPSRTHLPTDLCTLPTDLHIS